MQNSKGAEQSAPFLLSRAKSLFLKDLEGKSKSFSCNSLIYKYLTVKSLFLKDLAKITF